MSIDDVIPVSGWYYISINKNGLYINGLMSFKSQYEMAPIYSLQKISLTMGCHCSDLYVHNTTEHMYSTVKSQYNASLCM